MYEPADFLWEPQRRGVLGTIEGLSAGYDVCLYAPTGGGKTESAIELLNWATSKGKSAAFFANRTLLIGQTAARFRKAGLPFGVRAAGYEDMLDWSAPVQLVSTATEWARAYKSVKWDRLKIDVAVLDELHIQKAMMVQGIVEDLKSKGTKIVGMTATPIGVSHMADKLVVSGTMQEYRDCMAIVPAIVRGVSQPDMSKVKRNNAGEYVWKDKLRKVFIQHIVGSIYDNWRRFNPDARPTTLFAPGKPESVWVTEQFMKRGVNWCHVDATDAVVDGKREKLTRRLWLEIVERFKGGDIKGLSSRFKLREGIDIPEVYMAILATPIGSLSSYIQTVGRVLRYSSKTPDHVVVNDHGGNYVRHGSPNSDRSWKDWWNLPEGAVSREHVSKIKDQKTQEPICCPECLAERLSGITCPICGYVAQKSNRTIVMHNGVFKQHTGKTVKPKVYRRKVDTEKIWEGMFWGWRNKIVSGRMKPRTFAQMEGYFAYQNRYHAPRDIPFMPIKREDFYRNVHEVPLSDLVKRNESNVKDKGEMIIERTLFGCTQEEKGG